MQDLVREAVTADEAWIAPILVRAWGDTLMAVGGELIECLALPALVVPHRGVLTYRRVGDAFEIVSLDSAAVGRGVGTALLGTPTDGARISGLRSICMTMTNDNLNALGFYQRRGFIIDDIRVRAVAVARRLKPSIPPIAANGIPIRDEIVLRRAL